MVFEKSSWRTVCEQAACRWRLLSPHPVVAPVALPAGQSALAELQIKPVLVQEQAAAADVAEGQEDFVARTAADVVQRHAQSARGVFRIHSEHQRRVVRQRRGEGWRMWASGRREWLGACGSMPYAANGDQ